MSAFAYEALKSTVITIALPVRRAYRQWRTSRRDEPDRDEDRQIAELGLGRAPTRSPNLRGRSPSGSTSDPRNCSASATYQNPSQVSGLA